jgi:hypothetical protein
MVLPERSEYPKSWSWVRNCLLALPYGYLLGMSFRGMRESSTRTSVLPSTSARVLISAIVFIALSPAQPCFFFYGVAPLGIFQGGAEAILAAQRPDLWLKEGYFLKG